MITKQTAALLFAHGFRLVDKEGNIYEIASLNSLNMELYSEELGMSGWETVNYDQIGTDYWILKRPYSQLIKIVNHNGQEINIKELFWIEYGGGVELPAKKEWLVDFFFNITCTPIEKLPYDIVVKLYSLHFIDLPEGTYREME